MTSIMMTHQIHKIKVPEVVTMPLEMPMIQL
jgi:hypothetical protein